MAANMMDLLRQMQRDLADQKEYMRNLHVANRNLNEKLDKQQVTIENIERHVKKNNMVLFGNNDAENDVMHVESNKIDYEENKEKDAHLVEKTEKYMENIEEDQMQKEKKETVSNCGNDNMNNDLFEKTDDHNRNIQEFITKQLREVKESIDDFMASMKTSIEQATKQETVPTDVITDQMNNLNDQLKNISDIYQSDMKELINDLIATIKISNEETANILKKQETVSTFPNNLSTEQISKLCLELKLINDTYESEIQAKKELMEDVAASIKKINEEAASRVRKRVAVQITPTYLNTEQITKLNEELKRITEMYVSTDIFPIIEVQSGTCNHPVIQSRLQSLMRN